MNRLTVKIEKYKMEIESLKKQIEEKINNGGSPTKLEERLHNKEFMLKDCELQIEEKQRKAEEKQRKAEEKQRKAEEKQRKAEEKQRIKEEYNDKNIAIELYNDIKPIDVYNSFKNRGKDNHALHMYNEYNGLYEPMEDSVIGALILDRYEDIEDLGVFSKVRKWLDIFYERDRLHNKGVTRLELKNFNFNQWTVFKNGTLNTRTGEFEKSFSADHKNTFGISHNYIEDYPVCDISLFVDDLMDVITLGDKELQEFLWIYVGLSLAKSTTIDKCMFLYGSGENLKSVFMSMIEGAIPSNVIPLEKFGGSFGVAGVDSCNITYCTEVVKSNIEDCAPTYRMFTSQDTMMINEKNQRTYSNHPTSKGIYATNDKVMLGVGLNSKRREIYVPFKWRKGVYRDVDKDLMNAVGLDNIQDIKSFLSTNTDVSEYVLFKAVEGLRKYIDGYDLKEDLPKCVKDLTHELQTERDTVMQWLETLEDTSILLVQKLPTRAYYNMYKDWVMNEMDTELPKWDLNKLLVQENTFKQKIKDVLKCEIKQVQRNNDKFYTFAVLSSSEN